VIGVAYFGLYTFAAGFAAACLLFANAAPGVCIAVLLGAAVLALKFGGSARSGAPDAHTASPASAPSAFPFFTGLALGILWASFFTQFIFAPAKALEGDVSGLPVQVIEEPTVFGKRGSVTVEAESDSFLEPDVKISAYYDAGSATVRTGDRFLLVGTLADSREDGFYLLSRGITLVCEDAELINRDVPARIPLKLLPARAARAITGRIDELFSEDTYAFARALVLGDDSMLAPSLKFDLTNSGLSHIVALSGMNLAFFAGLLMLFLPKRAAPFVVLPAVFFFMAMTGFSPSILRAGVMLFISLTGPLVRREATPVNSLVSALVFILLINPYTITQASLVLSFLATLGILLFGERIKRAISFKTPFEGLSRFMEGIAGVLATTVSATALSVLALVLFFGRLSVVSPLSNLACLWAVEIGFILAMLAVGISFVFPPLASLIASAASALCRYVAGCAGYFARLPLASVGVSGTGAKLWIVAAYLVCLCLWILKPKKRIVLPSVFILSCSFFLAMFLAGAGQDGFTVRAFDVGQGSSVLVSYKGETMLFDCGGSKAQNAGDIVAERLADENIREIDKLVLSHYDEDHVNGLPRLLERMRVAEAYVPPEENLKDYETVRLLESFGAKVHYISDHEKIPGDVALDIYRETDILFENQMLMTLVRFGDFEMLVTGDADISEEIYLLFTEDIPDLDLLIVGHHGSKNSTSERFLRDTKPEFAFISVGTNNFYGHPSQEALERLKDAHAKVYRTDLNGELTFAIMNGEYLVFAEDYAG